MFVAYRKGAYKNVKFSKFKFLNISAKNDLYSPTTVFFKCVIHMIQEMTHIWVFDVCLLSDRLARLSKIKMELPNVNRYFKKLEQKIENKKIETKKLKTKKLKQNLKKIKKTIIKRNE